MHRVGGGREHLFQTLKLSLVGFAEVLPPPDSVIMLTMLALLHLVLAGPSTGLLT